MTKSSCLAILSVWAMAFISFGCKEFDKPVVSTSSVVGVTSSSAISGGNITDAGGGTIDDRGICASTSEDPTTDDIKISSGTGMGSFTCTVTKLSGNTTYYLRAFASNRDQTGYGESYSFTTPPSITDVEGNTYGTVVIGTQTWMAENLKTSKYRNGDPITYVPGTRGANSLDRAGPIEEAAYWDYDLLGPIGDVYGYFYNWSAVSDSRTLAPEGWHVPTGDEWTTLISYLGGEAEAAVKMRETGYTHWLKDCGGNNSNTSGFTARAAGMAGDDHRLWEARFWSATEENDTIAKYLFLDCSDMLYLTHDHKNMGYSVRCIKD